MDEDARREKREALLAWMARVDVDAVILEELRRRTALGLAWGEITGREREGLEALRETWAGRDDR